MTARVWRWVRENVLPGVAITVVLLSVVAAAGEAYLRLRIPFRSNVYPDHYVDGGGLVTVRPGAEVRSTNSISYWTAETSNSLGFLDREPRRLSDLAACRIVIIGDSLVQAPQVPNAVKMQARLEHHLSNALNGRPVQVVAAAAPGLGQISQLAYLPLVVEPMRPHLVILVAMSNDFANNSAVLSALRYGWHPDHMLRYYLRRDAATGRVIQVGPDPHGYERYLFLPAEGEVLPRARAHASLRERSYLYDWLFRLTARARPELLAWLSPNVPTGVETEVRRMHQIRAMPHYRDVFAGWNFPDDLWEDHMFWTEDLPPLFEDAVWLTEYAFREFRDAGRRQNFQVLIASADMRTPTDDLQQLIRAAGHRDALQKDGRLTRQVRVKGRTVLPQGSLDRLSQIAGHLGLPMIELETEMLKFGSLADARIPHDGHWSVRGHDRVGQVLASYIAARPFLCGVASAQ